MDRGSLKVKTVKSFFHKPYDLESIHNIDVSKRVLR